MIIVKRNNGIVASKTEGLGEPGLQLPRRVKRPLAEPVLGR
jgi:hypothetical protein